MDKPIGKTHCYRVIVGNIGTVCETDDLHEATRTYDEYKAMSASGVGRAAYEEVVYMCDHIVVEECCLMRPEERRLIGLSLSACIKDIVEGIVCISAVVCILSNTKARNEDDWEEIETRYCDTTWSQYPHTAKAVLRQLRDNNRLFQCPKYYGGKVWLSVTDEFFLGDLNGED